jgi:hypothetical protein
MTVTEFEDTLRQYLHRKPLAPFAVELSDGRVLTVDTHKVIFNAGAAPPSGHPRCPPHPSPTFPAPRRLVRPPLAGAAGVAISGAGRRTRPGLRGPLPAPEARRR